MNKTYVEEFKKGKLVVNCKTKTESKRFIKWCYDNNMRWVVSDINSTQFDSYNDICYRYSNYIRFDSYAFYKDRGYTIVSFDEMFDDAFTKDYLIVGRMVQCRDGSLFHVIATEVGIYFLGEDYKWFGICDINDDLISNNNHDIDIMSIYDLPLYAYKAFDFNTDYRNLLWQREEIKEMTVDKISEILGYKVKIIEGDK